MHELLSRETRFVLSNDWTKNNNKKQKTLSVKMNLIAFFLKYSKIAKIERRGVKSGFLLQ